MKFRVPFHKIRRGHKRLVIAGSVVVVVLVAGGAWFIFKPDAATISKPKASASAAAKAAANKARLQQFAQEHAANSTKGASTNAAKQASALAAAVEKDKITKARQDVTHAQEQKRLTDAQVKLINDKLAEISKFEASLSNPVTPAQRQSIFKEELAVRQWAAKNNISYHYVDVIVD